MNLSNDGRSFGKKILLKKHLNKILQKILKTFFLFSFFFDFSGKESERMNLLKNQANECQTSGSLDFSCLFLAQVVR